MSETASHASDPEPRLVLDKKCAKNSYAGYNERAEQIRIACIDCEKILSLIDVNIPLNFEEYRKHAVGHRVHSCLSEVQSRYIAPKGKIIVDCLECGYPIKTLFLKVK